MLDFAHEVPTATGDDISDEDLRRKPPPMHVRVGKTGGMRHKLVAGSALNTWRELVVNERIARVNGPRTSCGIPVAGYYGVIEEGYDGELCTVCFTPFELQFNTEIRAAHAEAARLEALKHDGRTKSQRVRLRREITHGAAEESRRLTTERMRKLMPDGSLAPDIEDDEGDDK